MASTAPPPRRVLGRPLFAFAFAAVLTYGAMLELAVRSYPPGRYGGVFGLVLHWLHQGTIILPVVLAAVWATLALTHRLPVAVPAGAASLAGALAFALGRAATEPLVVTHAHHAGESPRFADDVLVALVVALPLAGITVGAVIGSSPRGRRSLKTAAVLVAAAIFAGAAAWQAQADIPNASLLRDAVSPCFNQSPVAPPFTAQFVVPPRAAPALAPTDPSTDTYQITERRSTAEIIPGIPTPIWGYNGTFPGPTIVARKLRPVRVTFTNNLPPNEDPTGIIIRGDVSTEHPFLPSSTSVHLHGINADHLSDGYASDDLHRHRRNPGESLLHNYPNNEYQRPQTMWYHDHSVHITSVHLFRGLAGFYILQDEREDALRLPGSPLAEVPGQQGIPDGTTDPNAQQHFDIPLMLKDTMIDPATGLLVYDNCSHMGAFGDVMTVNGKQQPRFAVAARKYRFRLLNASDSRQYNIALRLQQNVGRPTEDLSANEPFTYIGTDQGLLPAPEPATHFQAVIAERHEFVVDFSKYPVGTRLVMVNLLTDPSDPKLFPLMAFDVTRPAPDLSQVPPALRGDEHPADEQPPSATRVFEFSKMNGPYWSINGQIFDEARDDAKPLLNTTEDWILDNNSGGWGHPVHIHLGRFRIIKIEGRPPNPGELRGYKDVVWLGPNQRITVRHQFYNFTGRFVFHCHNGSHEDFDMMSQFNVQPNP
jgi:spore coat protein A, manganese oxidase